MYPQAACIGLFGTSVKRRNHTLSVQLLSVPCPTQHFYTRTSPCTVNQHHNRNDYPNIVYSSNKVWAESTCKIIFGFRNGHYTRTPLRANLVYTIMVYVNCFFFFFFLQRHRPWIEHSQDRNRNIERVPGFRLKLS